MNIRNVLRTYSLLRQLTDDESALLETLREATDAERELIVETLSPQKSATKRAGKKASSKSASKSPRAQSLSGAIQRTPKVRVDDNDDDDPSTLPQYCLAMVDDNGGEIACGKTIDDNVHHKTTDPDYHEFSAGKSLIAASGD